MPVHNRVAGGRVCYPNYFMICASAVLTLAVPPVRALGETIIRAGGCEGPLSCEYEAGLSMGSTIQECGDDAWLSLAWPHATSGATVHSIQMTFRSDGTTSDLYLMADGGGCPDVENILWHGCCAIQPTGSEFEEQVFCTGPVETSDTTWVVLVPHSDPATRVAFDLFPQGLGHASVNVFGGSECSNWEDLTNYQSPYGESYGGCYCVALGTDPCDAQAFSCGDEEPSTCDPTPVCDGDANRDGVVDPLDVGYVLARFGADVCGPANCNADANCDGAIDPLDAGFVLARLAQCNPASACTTSCQ